METGTDRQTHGVPSVPVGKDQTASSEMTTDTQRDRQTVVQTYRETPAYGQTEYYRECIWGRTCVAAVMLTAI